MSAEQITTAQVERKLEILRADVRALKAAQARVRGRDAMGELERMIAGLTAYGVALREAYEAAWGEAAETYHEALAEEGNKAAARAQADGVFCQAMRQSLALMDVA